MERLNLTFKGKIVAWFAKNVVAWKIIAKPYLMFLFWKRFGKEG